MIPNLLLFGVHEAPVKVVGYILNVRRLAGRLFFVGIRLSG